VTKTTLARPAPQVLGFSSAGDKSSVVLASLREKALASAADRNTSIGILEWSAPDDCALDDRVAWAQANPALGHRMSEQAIASALEVDPPEVFTTEVLNRWATTVDPAIDGAVWSSLADPDAERGDGLVFALGLAPDHSTATVTAGRRRPDGAVMVMVADHREGVEWVVPRCAGLVNRWGGRLIVERSGTAGFLLPALQQARVTVEPVGRRVVAVWSRTAWRFASQAGTAQHFSFPDLRKRHQAPSSDTSLR
jgi:hypothetical protein